MASFLSYYSLLIFTTTLFSTSFFHGFSHVDHEFLLSESLAINKPEKLSHFHFYFHDVLSGKNPSAVLIIAPPNPTLGLGFFGQTYVIDDPLTIGRDPNSKMIGRAQGFYSTAAQNDLALLMTVNLVFVEGKYNGSSLSILGRNPVLNDIRELPIVGGSGLFRFARGYALAHTVMFELKTGDAIVEYNLYVLHY